MRFILTEETRKKGVSVGYCPECGTMNLVDERKKFTVCSCGTKCRNVRWSMFISVTMISVLLFLFSIVYFLKC